MDDHFLGRTPNVPPPGKRPDPRLGSAVLSAGAHGHDVAVGCRLQAATPTFSQNDAEPVFIVRVWLDPTTAPEFQFGPEFPNGLWCVIEAWPAR